MTYKEWVEKHGHIDHVVRPILPPDEELDNLTRKQLLEKLARRSWTPRKDWGSNSPSQNWTTFSTECM